MLKTRVALLGVLALFIASGIATSTASASGPFWHVKGSKLAQGTKQLKLQLKGSATLTSKIAAVEVTITCASSKSEGATIEGSGVQKPGQDKGSLVFSQCKFPKPLLGCQTQEVIQVKQTKSRLVTFKGAQTKYADLFEPQQGETFATIILKNNGAETCNVKPVQLPVKGSVAAEIVPKEAEVQEMLLNFPETPINTVFVENEQKNQQEELSIGLFLGVEEAKFKAAYGSRLETEEPFGVFST
jgi:hypothetical protein